MMWQVRPTGGLQREGIGVKKTGASALQGSRRANRPVLNSLLRKPESVDANKRPEKSQTPETPATVNRRQIVQGGLWGLFSLFGLGAASAPAQVIPVVEKFKDSYIDIPIETFKPLSPAALRKSGQAVEQVKPHLFPFEQRLLSRLQSLQEKANALVAEAQTLKRQGQNPRQVIEREAHKAMNGDREAQAVLEYLQEHFSVDRE